MNQRLKPHSFFSENKRKDVCIIDTDLQQSATLQREQDKQTFGDADGECAISGWLCFNKIQKTTKCIP